MLSAWSPHSSSCVHFCLDPSNPPPANSPSNPPSLLQLSTPPVLSLSSPPATQLTHPPIHFLFHSFNSHTTKVTFLKHTFCWFLIYSQSWATISTIHFQNISSSLPPKPPYELIIPNCLKIQISTKQARGRKGPGNMHAIQLCIWVAISRGWGRRC